MFQISTKWSPGFRGRITEDAPSFPGAAGLVLGHEIRLRTFYFSSTNELF